MPRHYHSETYHHQVRFMKHTRRIALGVGLLFVVLILVVGIDTLNQDQLTTPSQETLATTATYSPQIKVFRSAYFQFQAGNSWSEVRPQSTTDTFVYRSLRDR